MGQIGVVRWKVEWEISRLFEKQKYMGENMEQREAFPEIKGILGAAAEEAAIRRWMHALQNQIGTKMSSAPVGMPLDVVVWLAGDDFWPADEPEGDFSDLDEDGYLDVEKRLVEEWDGISLGGRGEDVLRFYRPQFYCVYKMPTAATSQWEDSRLYSHFSGLSFLLRRPPGREAYPGDVFYLDGFRPSFDRAGLIDRITKLLASTGVQHVEAMWQVELLGRSGSFKGGVVLNEDAWSRCRRGHLYFLSTGSAASTFEARRVGVCTR